jgi:hypothetical protein
MKELLFHVSKTRIEGDLKPYVLDRVYFSKGKFSSFFGDTIYIFDFDTIQNNFELKKKVFNSSTRGGRGAVVVASKSKKGAHRVITGSIGEEYTVDVPVNLEKYCIGVATHFNESADCHYDYIREVSEE